MQAFAGQNGLPLQADCSVVHVLAGHHLGSSIVFQSNLAGPATKPSDVVVAANGMSIEVNNTDAGAFPSASFRLFSLTDFLPD